MWHEGRHFCTERIDSPARRTCDCSIACRMREGGMLVGYIGVLEDILKITFIGLYSIVILKKRWYKYELW